MTTAILIPARLKSTRFENKPLTNLDGKTMIRRVFDETIKFGYDTFVLTDSKEVADCIPKNNVIMTSSDCTSGTDRCMSVIGSTLHYDKYINVQGDNPDPTLSVVEAIDKALDTTYACQAYKHMTSEAQANPNVHKMIMTNDVVHWICRSALRYGNFALGFHGYTAEAADIWKKCKIYNGEEIETSEALRWIENGYRLTGVYTPFDGIEINIPEDAIEWHKQRKIKFNG